MPAMTKALQAAHARASSRLHKWLDSKIERDAAGITRLYRLSQTELDDKLRQIYFTYLAEEPTYVRARQTGALGAIDRAVDETISEVTRKIYDKTREDITGTLGLQTGKLRRGVGRLRKLGMKVGELFLSGEQVANALTTDVVVGGTYADRLFHISSKVKSDLTREIRQGLFNAETFDDVRERIHKVFGVDRLATPKSHAAGSLKVYKNEARRQWNLLMKERGKREEGRTIWFTLLDQDATPGCVARHGMTLEELDDPDIPHHPNCRCTVIVVPDDFDTSDLKIEATAWLKAEGWTKKDAMLEESGRPPLMVRPLVETCEKFPGLARVEFTPQATLAVVGRATADVLMMGEDPGVVWSTGDPRTLLNADLQDTPIPEPIVAVGAKAGPGIGLLALVEARSGRLLYRAREARASDSYTRAVCLVPDKGFVWAVSHEDFPAWSLPGGHVEEGEDPKDAAAREFGEETGRACRIVRYMGEFELTLANGTLTNNMLYEGVLTGSSSGSEQDKDERIIDAKPVHVIELDEKERTEVERLWFTEFHKSDLAEAADVVHVLRSGRVVAYPHDGPRRQIVLAAPHGDTDTGTGKIVDALRRRLECSAVIAQGFDPADNGGDRLNINRPTQGITKDPAKGEDASAEKPTEQARRVYLAWMSGVLEAAGGRPQLYVEIHDNDYEPTQDHLEVATLRVKDHEAMAMKRSWASLDTSLDIKVEPVDELEWRGIVAKHIGVFKYMRRAVQVELPKKFCDQAAAGVHGAIEELEDWLEDVIGILL